MTQQEYITKVIKINGPRFIEELQQAVYTDLRISGRPVSISDEKRQSEVFVSLLKALDEMIKDGQINILMTKVNNGWEWKEKPQYWLASIT